MSNRTTSGLLFLGALTLCTGSAMASELMDYAAVQLASQSVSPGSGYSDLTGTALVLSAGKNFDQIQPGLAFEGEMSKSVDNPSRSFSGTKVDSDITTVSALAVYRWGITADAALRVKGGLRWATATTKVEGAGSDTSSETGGTFGLGATYAFNKNSDFQAEYTAISNDVTNISAGVQFRF